MLCVGPFTQPRISVSYLQRARSVVDELETSVTKSFFGGGGVCLSSNFLMKRDVSEAGSAFVFRQGEAPNLVDHLDRTKQSLVLSLAGVESKAGFRKLVPH